MKAKLTAENGTHGRVSVLGELEEASEQAHNAAAELAAQSTLEAEAEALSASKASRASKAYQVAQQKSNASAALLEDLKQFEGRDSISENSTLMELDKLNRMLSAEDLILSQGVAEIEQSAKRAADVEAVTKSEQQQSQSLAQTVLALRESEHVVESQSKQSQQELEALLDAIQAVKRAIDVAQERQLSEKQQEADSLKSEDVARAKSQQEVN
jgi:hypothetical protein